MKGITKTSDGKFTAQYWSKELKTTIRIGSFDTEDEAVYERAIYLSKVYDGEIDESLPKTKRYPKGISEAEGKFKAEVQLLNRRGTKRVNRYVGLYDTVYDAVQARKEFILKLL